LAKISDWKSGLPPYIDRGSRAGLQFDNDDNEYFEINRFCFCFVVFYFDFVPFPSISYHDEQQFISYPDEHSHLSSYFCIGIRISYHDCFHLMV
jgi:hypothetical protein